MTCSYCRSSSFVQRTRKPPPAQRAIPAGTPVIRVQSGSGKVFVWVALAMAALIAAGSGIVWFWQNKTMDSVAIQQAPLLFDANGDGVEDAVLAVAVMGSRQGFHLRAVDGNTGELLWKTESSGTPVEQVALAGDAVLWFLAGKVLGFDAKTGAERFVRDLPERAQGVCEVERRWFLLTADEKVHAIDPATGALTPSAAAGVVAATPGLPSCTPAWSTFHPSGRLIRADRSDVRDEAMTVATQLHYGNGTQPALAVGRRTKGTQVPMLGGVVGGRVVWKVELPATAPLEVVSGEPTAVTLAGERAYASYARTSTPGYAVVAVALANGQRLWETYVPRKQNATHLLIRANDRHVFVTAEAGLYALAASDGRRLWHIGWDSAAL